MRFDVIFENPQIFDGTGRAPFRNDVAVKGGKIAAVEKLNNAKAKTRIDASCLALCPGFVDVHTHAEMALHQPQYEKIVEPLVRQGITTFVGGNCGAGLGPISPEHAHHQYDFYDIFLGSDQRPYITWQGFGEMLDVLEKKGMVQNCAMLAPHGVIRAHAMGDSTELAKPEHIAKMKPVLARCLEEGAVGMSTGLMYFPGLCSDERELLELGRVLHDYNAVFTSHLRSYNSDTIGRAIDEVLEIGKAAQIPIQISHLFWVPNLRPPWNGLTKALMKGVSFAWNKKNFPFPVEAATKPYLKQIEKLNAQGIPVGVDSMPTSAGFTHLFAFFPPWSLKGGREAILKLIADPESRREMRRGIEKGEPIWPHRGENQWSMNLFKVMGWDCAFIMSVASDKNQHLVGKSFVEIGKMEGKHPFDAACDIALEEQGRVLIFETPTFPGDEFVELSLKGTLLDKNVSVATDTIPIVFGRPSHLTYDCFPRFVGGYARDRGYLPVAEAIRKCTSLPARQLQIKNRGTIETGAFADLVLFDPEKIGSNSTATDPAHFAAGIESVFVNGVAVVDSSGYHPEKYPGRMLRRQ
jgi:N-acyl-D-aspartate/D-glutamate deacylase